METGKGSKKRTLSTRKPLVDITNLIPATTANLIPAATTTTNLIPAATTTNLIPAATTTNLIPAASPTNLIPAATTSLRKVSSTNPKKPQFLSASRDLPAKSSLVLTSETSNSFTSNVVNSSVSNASIKASDFRTPSRTRTGKGNSATNEKLIVYSTRGTVSKTKNEATDLFGFSPVSRPWDSVTNIKGKRKAEATSDNCPTMKKMKDKENVTALNLEKSRDIHLSTRKQMVTNTDDFTEEDVILQENVNSKRKAISTGHSSSDNKPRSNRDNLNKSKDKSPMKAHTESKKKRQCSSMQQKQGVTPECDLQKEYIEKQRSYFKEVDEFELPVEMVSSSDSD